MDKISRAIRSRIRSRESCHPVHTPRLVILSVISVISVSSVVYFFFTLFAPSRLNPIPSKQSFSP